jgi:hypothetical protein
MHTMPQGELRQTLAEVKALVEQDRDFLRPVVEAVLQELLKAEMTEAQPGGSQGRPATNASSQLIQCIGLPTLRAPSAPQPGWSHHTLCFGILHRKTRVGSPRTNGFVERFDGIVLEEFFRPKMCSQPYQSGCPAGRPRCLAAPLQPRAPAPRLPQPGPRRPLDRSSASGACSKLPASA